MRKELTKLTITEDPETIWMDDLTGEEMDRAEASWEIYCCERPFDHLSMARWIVTDMEVGE